MRKSSWLVLLSVLGIFASASFWYPSVKAQSDVPAEVAKYGYADEIVINGKIVSMDDYGYNNNPGHIYQAMALKGNKILALGTVDQIRAMANKDTKVLDVGGRTVTPGIIDTHAHLFGNGQIAAAMGIHTPDKGVSLTIAAGKDMEATRLNIENGIKGAISKLQPGDWVNVGVNPNTKEGITASRVAAWVSRGELEPRERLSRVAPVNPVIVQAGTRATINSNAWDLANKLIPHFGEYEAQEVADVADGPQKGVLAVGGMMGVTWDIWYGGQPIPMLSEMIRRDWEMAAAHGETAFGSRIYNPKTMNALTYLNRSGQAPVRFMALIETHRRPAQPEMVRQLYAMTGDLTGLGDDMMWMGGVASELWDSSFPQVCLGPDLPAPPEIKIREKCPQPGEMYWDALQNALEAGWRTAGVHGVGSHGVRLYTQVIERAMKNKGFTTEYIKSLNLTTEHAEALGNMPDLMAEIKKLGIIISVNPIRMLRTKDCIQDYGPAAEKFMMPVKSWLDQGIYTVGQFEGYRGMGYNFSLLITRNADGKIVLPDQKLDRVTVLKMWTTWAPKYMLKEGKIGTLEPGRYADFIVMDKDYFTVPVDQIQKIKPQMTVMDGKVRYLGPDFAKELKTETVGYQYPADYEPWDRSAMREAAQ